MAILSFSEMPTSFTGHALDFASKTKWLNLRTISGGDATPFTFVRMVCLGLLRSFALNVYTIGTAVLCAPVGVVYHGASALRQKAISWLNAPGLRARSDALAWEHFKAMLTDISGIALVFFGGYYAVCQIHDPKVGLAWWFSSTPVHTDMKYKEPCQMANLQGHQDVGHLARSSGETSWGHREIVEQCPYQEMRVSVIRHWEEEGKVLALNAPEILKKLLTDRFHFNQRILEERLTNPTFVSKSYVCVSGTYRPNYSFPEWKTCRKIIILVGGIVLLSWGSIFYLYSLSFIKWKLISKFSMLLTLLISNVYICLALLSLQFARICYWLAAREVKATLSSQEMTLYNKLLAQKRTEDGLEDKTHANGKRAAFWLKKAASRGNPEAQRILGLSLLAAVSNAFVADRQMAESSQFEREWKTKLLLKKLPEDETMRRLWTYALQNIDPETLWVVREGVAWLRAARYNGDPAAYNILSSLNVAQIDLSLLRTPGASETDRNRALLVGFGQKAGSLKEVADSYIKTIPSEEARRKLVSAFAALRNDIHTDWIQKAVRNDKVKEPGLSDERSLCALVAEYLVGVDEKSLFLTPPPAPAAQPAAAH